LKGDWTLEVFDWSSRLAGLPNSGWTVEHNDANVGWKKIVDGGESRMN
jgi:hypothetical protein